MSPCVTHEGTSSHQVLAILRRVLRTGWWPYVPIDNSISRVDYGTNEFNVQACLAGDTNFL
jgi:pyruvate/2-oxoacid:ferredoxin oxidoreductase beta subunit